MTEFSKSRTLDLTLINFSDFQNLDPLLNNQTKIYRDLKLEIKIKFIKEDKKILFSDKNNEEIKIRILDEFITNEEKITKIEIKSEFDLFFYYCHIVDANSFVDLKHKMGLNCDFEDYVAFLVKIFDDFEKEKNKEKFEKNSNFFSDKNDQKNNRNSVKKNSGSTFYNNFKKKKNIKTNFYDIFFLIHPDGNATLQIFSKNEFKKFLLFSLNFSALPKKIVKTQCSYRYSTLKAEVDILETRLVNVLNIVKKKNPPLALLLSKYIESGNDF